MFIEFVGDWKLLKHMGYKFSNMHGHNHICYINSINPISHIFIWKKGKTVEFLDVGVKSYLILRYLLKNKFRVHNEHNMLVIDNDLNTVEVLDWDKHEYYPEKRISEMTEEEREHNRSEMLKFYKRYQKIPVVPELCQAIKELHMKGFIQINLGEPIASK